MNAAIDFSKARIIPKPKALSITPYWSNKGSLIVTELQDQSFSISAGGLTLEQVRAVIDILDMNMLKS